MHWTKGRKLISQNTKPSPLTWIMKILFLINSLKVGGAEKTFVSQANGLLERGIDVYFGVLEPQEGVLNYLNQIKVAKENYFCFDQKGLYDWRCYKKIIRLTKNKNINIIYATLPAASLAARIAKIFNPKLRVIVREANVANVKSWKMRLADILLLPFTFRIIAVSEIVKGSMGGYLFFGGSKVRVLHNSIELPPPIDAQEVEATRNKYKLSGKYIILNIGALNARQKGQIYALKSLKQLTERGCRDVKLLLAGDVRIRQEWADFIKENALEDSVAFLGYLPPQELNKFYALADLFILPSLWEGFPNVILEAMAHGCPVIATDVGGVREAISHDYNGIVIEPRDAEALTQAILRVKNDPVLTKKFSENGLQVIKEKFLFQPNLEKLMQILGI